MLPQIARIVVDSVVLAFEKMYGEVAHDAGAGYISRAKFDRSRMISIIITMNEDDTTAQQQSTFDALLSKLMDARFRRFTDKRKASIIVDCLWNEAFLEGEAKSMMIDRVRSHFRTNVFSPWKILKAMDLAGFNLSLAGVEVLRRVDSTEKYSRGILPSEGSILRAARKVEANADALCPFKMIGRAFEDNNECSDASGDVGEGFEFDTIKTTKTLFDSFGLTADAKHRSVELALTCDGAQLTNTLSHVAVGVKFNDMGMRDPVTKQPLFLHHPDALVQSRNWCFPYRVTVEKDTKKSLEGTIPLYSAFNNGDVAAALGFRPLKLSCTGDMKLQWGALGKGGAAKVMESFCYICSCVSSTLHVPQDWTKCDICKDKQCADGECQPCYHYEFLSSEEVREKLEDELAIVTALLTGFNQPNDPRQQKGRMYVRGPGHVAIADDKLDIDYWPITVTDTTTFSRQVNVELVSRSLSVLGSLAVRQQRHREQLVNEQRICDIQHMLTHSAPRDKAMYLVMQAVVCILHLENRVGLKSIEMILRSGFSNATEGALEWIASTGIQKRQEHYVARVTNIIQTRILGTESAPSQWRFPLTDDGKVGSLSMDNNRTRAIINEIDSRTMEKLDPFLWITIERGQSLMRLKKSLKCQSLIRIVTRESYSGASRITGMLS